MRIHEVLELLLIVLLRQKLAEFTTHAVCRRPTQQSHPSISLVHDLKGVMTRVVNYVEQRVVEQHIHWVFPLLSGLDASVLAEIKLDETAAFSEYVTPCDIKHNGFIVVLTVISGGSEDEFPL